MNRNEMPTTAREALDLAWKLAHPIKEGQVTPKGTRAIDRTNGVIVEYIAEGDWTPRDLENIRTLDPLPEPEPEPDWLDAPFVLAAHKDSHVNPNRVVWARSPIDSDRWVTGLVSAYWTELRDVTPLYPKETE